MVPKLQICKPTCTVLDCQDFSARGPVLFISPKAETAVYNFTQFRSDFMW